MPTKKNDPTPLYVARTSGLTAQRPTPVTRAEFDALKQHLDTTIQANVLINKDQDNKITALESQVAESRMDIRMPATGVFANISGIISRLDKLEQTKLDITSWNAAQIHPAQVRFTQDHAIGVGTVEDMLERRLAAIERRLGVEGYKVGPCSPADSQATQQAKVNHGIDYANGVGHLFTDNGEGKCARCLDSKVIGSVPLAAPNERVKVEFQPTPLPRIQITPEQVEQFLLESGLGFDPDNESIGQGLASRINEFFNGGK